MTNLNINNEIILWMAGQSDKPLQEIVTSASTHHLLAALVGTPLQLAADELRKKPIAESRGHQGLTAIAAELARRIDAPREPK